MSGHTPGPWTKHGTQIRKDGLYLASSRQSGLNADTARANAFLIAAAPELLAVCKLALKSWFSGEICEISMELALREAIDKAEPNQ